MSEIDLIDIEERDRKGYAGPDDVAALLKHTEDLADKLSTCWLLLDQMAREKIGEEAVLQQARKILISQECPGWKTN